MQQHNRPDRQKRVAGEFFADLRGPASRVPAREPRRAGRFLIVLLIIAPLLQSIAWSQVPIDKPIQPGPVQLSEILRLETVPVPGGSELITIHARLDGLGSDPNQNWVPMVSILRDTL